MEDALRAACAMSDETGERDDDVTVDDKGCIVNTVDPVIVVQSPDRARDTYEAWQKAEEKRRAKR